MRTFAIAVFITIATLAGAQNTNAEILRYRDENGNLIYVDTIEKVPEKYRSQIKQANDLPKITRVPDATYTGTYNSKAKALSKQEEGADSRSQEWQQKYADCKTLAGVMKNGSDGVIKPPNCERIPQLCANNSSSPDCQQELQRYYRK